MKAFALETGGKPASLIELPKPSVGADDVRVAIRAASVNGFDVYQAAGGLTEMMEHRFPTVVGRDFSGVVEAVGDNVTDYGVGDEVMGFVPSALPLEVGTYAEFVGGGTRADAQTLVLARKPAGIDFNQAAALPLAGSAALDVLEAIDGRPGDVVLVVGATGGVGSFLIQLAKPRGLTVIATARADETSFVRELGADDTVDYAAGNVADAVKTRYPGGVAALVDLVTRGDALTALAAVVREGGHVASLLGAADDEKLKAIGITSHNVAATPTTDKLRQLGELAAAGALHVPIQAVYPIDRAGDAFEAFGRGTLGKLVIRV